MKEKEKEKIDNNDWLDEQLKREENNSSLNLDNRKKKNYFLTSKGTSDPFFVIDLILMSLMIPFSLVIEDNPIMPSYILLMFVLPGVIMWDVIFHKFPPTWYFILGLIMAIVAQLMVLKS